MDTLNSLLTSGHKDLADSYNRIVTSAKLVKEHEIPDTNLFIRGFGRDVNGNKLVYVSIMDGRRSGIQTMGDEDLKTVNREYDMSIFSSGDAKTISKIEDEVLEYVKKYGDPSIKSRLKLYGDRKNTAKSQVRSSTETNSYDYMMLGRLKQDCEYFLKYGGRNPKHLHQLNVEDQIKEMKRLWNKVKEKPEWLSMEDINDYEKRMKSNKVTAANDDTLFVLTYISCERTEDDFEEGEIGKYQSVFNEKCGEEFKTFDELIKYVSTNYGISDNKKDWYIYDDEIRVSYQVNEDNEKPSSSEIASWKLGEVKLYNADVYVKILFAKEPKGNELEKITGLRFAA